MILGTLYPCNHKYDIVFQEEEERMWREHRNNWLLNKCTEQEKKASISQAVLYQTQIKYLRKIRKKKKGIQSAGLYSHSNNHGDLRDAQGPWEQHQEAQERIGRAVWELVQAGTQVAQYRYLLCFPRRVSVPQRGQQDKRQSVCCNRCQYAQFWIRIQVTVQSLMFFITNTVVSLDLMEWREKSTHKQHSVCSFPPPIAVKISTVPSYLLSWWKTLLYA